MMKRSALRPDLPIQEALLSAALEMLTAARNAISDSALKTDEAVHEFRKAIKRWRAFLRLIEPFLGDSAKTLRAGARMAAQKLGGARDLRSVLDALDDIRDCENPLDELAFETCRTKISALLTAEEQKGVTAADRAAIAAEVERWRKTIEQQSFERIGFAEISEALTDGYRRAFRTLPQNWSKASEDELHEFRRRAIDHRYQLELIEPLWPRMTRIWIDEVQRLRDALGKHRDLALLQLLAGTRQPLAAQRAALLPAIGVRQQAHLARAEKIASRIFAEKPGAFRRRIESLWQAGGGDD